jgi:hypothetical protein
MTSLIKSREEEPIYRGQTLAIFFAALAIHVFFTVYLLYFNGFSMFDAIARTSNAFYVLYLQPPKLASIGFVWNPLPSLLQIPILLFSKLWPPLASYGVAGGFVTSLFAAFNAAYMFRAFKYYGQSTATSLFVIALFASNPFMFYYGVNGMSEVPFFTCQIMCTVCIMRWYETRRTRDLIEIAFALVLGFFCRYEVLAVAAALGICLLLLIFFTEDPVSPFKRKTFKMKFHYAVSTCIITFLPLIYAIGIWILLNWMIMGEPFYFTSSVYSNSAQTASDLSGIFVDKMASPLDALKHMSIRSVPFILPAVPILVERIYTRRLLKTDMAMLFVMIILPIAFHFYMLMGGSSYGWLRFSSYAYPTIMAFYPYELSKIKRYSKKLFLLLFAAALFFSGWLLINVYFPSIDLAAEEYVSIFEKDASFINQQRVVADLINKEYSNDYMLVDTVATGGIIVSLERPEMLITNINDNYDAAIREPWKYNIRYVMAIDPETWGSKDVLNEVFPDIYENGAEWLSLVEDLDGIRIYEVIW